MQLLDIDERFACAKGQKDPLQLRVLEEPDRLVLQQLSVISQLRCSVLVSMSLGVTMQLTCLTNWLCCGARFSSNAKRETIFLWGQSREDVVPSARRRRNCRPVSPAHDPARATFLEALYSNESSPPTQS
jgi:hypothetical protein